LKASASGTNTVPVLFQQNQRNEVREMPVAGALPAQPGMKQQNYLVAFQPWASGSRGFATGEQSPTITDGQQVGVSCGASVRRLTPLECERLQGFPDNWTEGHSDSHRYRMLGNAVAVPVVERIMRRIASIEAREGALL
jgi:DNA (cytosine-5)-methyltransferase 1